MDKFETIGVLLLAVHEASFYGAILEGFSDRSLEIGGRKDGKFEITLWIWNWTKLIFKLNVFLWSTFLYIEKVLKRFWKTFE